MLVGGEGGLRVEGPVRLGHSMDEIRTGCGDVIVYLPRRSKKDAASSNRETASEETDEVSHRIHMKGATMMLGS
jgi:hypothetical protein